MNNKIIGYVCVLLIVLQGCMADTLPTVKKLDRGERIAGFSVATPWPSAAGFLPSWSIWYGRGIDNKTDQYTFIGESMGVGVFFNRKVNGNDYSYTTLNLGAGWTPFGFGFFPKLGINYSEGEKNRQSIGLLASIWSLTHDAGKWNINDQHYPKKVHLYLGTNNSYIERRIGLYRIDFGKEAIIIPSFEYSEGSKK